MREEKQPLEEERPNTALLQARQPSESRGKVTTPFGAHSFHLQKSTQTTTTPRKNSEGARLPQWQQRHQPHHTILLRVFHEEKPPSCFQQEEGASIPAHAPNSFQSPNVKVSNTFLCLLKSRKIAFKLAYISSEQAKSSLPFCSKAVWRQESTERERLHCKLNREMETRPVAVAHCRGVSFLLSVPMIKGDPAFHLKEGLEFVWGMRKWLGMFCGREG